MQKIASKDISKELLLLVYGRPGEAKTSFGLSASLNHEIAVFNWDKPAAGEYNNSARVNLNNIYYEKYEFDRRGEFVADPKWTKDKTDKEEDNFDKKIMEESSEILLKFESDLNKCPTEIIVIDGVQDLDICVKQKYSGRSIQIPASVYTLINGWYRRIMTNFTGKHVILLSQAKEEYIKVMERNKLVDKTSGRWLPSCNKKVLEQVTLAINVFVDRPMVNGKKQLLYKSLVTKHTAGDNSLLDMEFEDLNYEMLMQLL